MDLYTEFVITVDIMTNISLCFGFRSASGGVEISRQL